MAKQQNTGLSKGKSKFQLVGIAKINDFTFTIDKESTSSDFIYNRINLGVDCGNGNVVYAEMMGGYKQDGSTVVYAHGKSSDGKKEDYTNKLAYAWDERLEEKNFSSIGESCFIKVGLEKDVKGNTATKKFLSAYDAIEYVQACLTPDTVVTVSGNLEYSVYDGQTQTKKIIKSIYLSKATPEQYKATFTQTFLITKDSIGKVDAEKNSLPIYGYVPEYVGKIDKKEIKKTLLIPKEFEFDLNKHNMTVIKALIQRFLKFKAGYYLEMGVDGEFKEGVATAVATLDDLDPELKMLIEIGVMTAEQALSKTAITGNREKRMIFSTPNIIKGTTKNEDGSETPTQSVDINPERYTIDSVEMYDTYANADSLDNLMDNLTDVSNSDNVLDDSSLDFLNNLV